MKAEIDVSVGDIVFYRLEPRSLPVNPERVWTGKVEWLHSKKCLFVVSSLEQGYEGLCEIVYTSQIVKIEKGTFTKADTATFNQDVQSLKTTGR